MNHPTVVPISASQLSTFKDCPRKWGYDKIECVPRGETTATAEGHLIHAEVETYFKTGVAPSRAESKALLPHLPPRGVQVVAEHDFQFVWPGVEQALVRGYIDLIDLSDGTVYDHKTSGNLSRAVKSVADLRLDAQSILYGAAMRMVRPSDDVTLQWTYVQREAPKTRPPKTIPVRQIQSLSDLKAGLDYWTPVVQELVQIVSSKTKILDIAPNRQSCYKYGPCQYKDLCPDFVGAPKKVVVAMSPEMMARLAAMSAGTVRPEVAPVPPLNTQRPMDEIVEDPAVKTAHKMPLLDALRIDFASVTSVNPPDVQPDVSPQDPPVPIAEEVAPAKAKRGRPAKVTPVESGIARDEAPPPWGGEPVENSTPVVTPIEAAPIEAATTYERDFDRRPNAFDLDAFITGVLARAGSEAESFDQTLEAARIAVELLRVRAGGK